MDPNEYKYMYAFEGDHWWFISRRELVIYLIQSWGKPLPVILDVGCGTGGTLWSFRKLGKSFGMDSSEKSMDFCRRRNLDNVVQSSAEHIAYGNNFFDIVTCLDTLEHVINPIGALLEMKRVLKDDGKIIITVPAFRILWSRHDESLGHLRRYEKDLLLRHLREAGLKVDKTGYFFFTSFFMVAPIRIIRRLLFSQKKRHSDTATLPPKLLNEFLKLLLKIEMMIAKKFDLPFGTTVYAVASKMG